MQRMAMFDPNIKRRDQPPYFRQAIKEFQLVVDRYPKTRYADEALVRIARLHRRLDEPAEARAAYERLLRDYPESEYTEEANEQIAQLGR
ncbi:tetratricopeptide repeat protein [bacterium]|nr:tetratricopeptide repeat protein [bacterium]